MNKSKDLFPIPDSAELIERLQKPRGKVDIILDTDTYNEADDQFALAYLVNSPERLNIQAITAAPFWRPVSVSGTFRSSSPADGMQKSFDEIKKILKMTGRESLWKLVFRGSEMYLPDELTPVDSDAARKMVELAKEHDSKHPLYIVAIGAVTNVASALLMCPEITKNVVVVWLAGQAQHVGGCDEFNMRQDIAAARVVFGCGVALVQLPCTGVVSEFRFSRPELEYWFRDKNPLCNYLIEKVYEYAKEKFNYPDWSKPLWDVTAVAWLLSDDWTMDRIIPSPIPQNDLVYGYDLTRHPIRYVYYVKKDPIINDLAKKLWKF